LEGADREPHPTALTLAHTRAVSRTNEYANPESYAWSYDGADPFTDDRAFVIPYPPSLHLPLPTTYHGAFIAAYRCPDHGMYASYGG
jgi:hypothetical protein